MYFPALISPWSEVSFTGAQVLVNSQVEVQRPREPGASLLKR